MRSLPCKWQNRPNSARKIGAGLQWPVLAPPKAIGVGLRTGELGPRLVRPSEPSLLSMRVPGMRLCVGCPKENAGVASSQRTHPMIFNEKNWPDSAAAQWLRGQTSLSQQELRQIIYRINNLRRLAPRSAFLQRRGRHARRPNGRTNHRTRKGSDGQSVTRIFPDLAAVTNHAETNVAEKSP
jgi:hypothetical protein